MEEGEPQGGAARMAGDFALVIGFLITIVGLVTDSVPLRGYFFAGLLVFLGVGLRLDATITDHHR